MKTRNPFWNFLQPLSAIFREAEDGTGTGEPPADPPAEDGTPPADNPSLISGAGDTSADDKGEKLDDDKTDDKSDDDKSEDEGGKEDDKDEAPEPITMENLTLPEGMEFHEEQGEAFLEMVNDADLSKTDLVNKMLEMHKDSVTQSVQSLMDEWGQTREGWKTETQALPEIGGEKLNETLATIKSGLEAAGATNEVFETLDATGAGDNPHMIQLFHKLVQPFLEKSPSSGDAPTTPEDRAKRMFPSMGKKE